MTILETMTQKMFPVRAQLGSSRDNITMHPRTVGPYQLYHPNIDTYWYRRADEVLVQMDVMLQSAGPFEVWKLSVKQGDESWTIFGGLWSVTRPETNVPYPHHQFRWNWEGKLCEVQVHLSGTTWVQYSLMGNPRRYFSQHAGQDVIDMAPLSLNGLTELFGVSIPWQLDVQAKIQELLEAAELEKFLFHLAQS